ncbi:MAG: GNAT family N-acetyltransferase [Dongiaceae bacterium]
MTTTRLWMRPYELVDAEKTFAMFSDPEAMRYVGDGADTMPEETRQRLQRMINRQAQPGSSLGAVIEALTGELIGDCGLVYLDGGPEIEAGYRFRQQSWGRGYTSEAAAAWLAAAFGELALTDIVAVSRPENIASRRVLEKIGLKPRGTGHYYNRWLPVYCLTRQDWQAMQRADNRRERQ